MKKYLQLTDLTMPQSPDRLPRHLQETLSPDGAASWFRATSATLTIPQDRRPVFVFEMESPVCCYLDDPSTEPLKLLLPCFLGACCLQ